MIVFSLSQFVPTYHNNICSYQADNMKLASDGFMLNFLSVMYELSAKAELDKIHPLYPFHPESRVDISQETKLKLSAEQYETFVKSLGMLFSY